MNNKITSIDAFLDVIKSVDDDISIEKTKEIIANISLELNYTDPLLCAELTTPYIEMLQDYQESVYRLYLLINDRPEDLRTLGDYEKECFNLKYKVSPGSNIFGVTFEVDKLAEILVPTMGSKKALAALLLIIGYMPTTEFLDYLKEKEASSVERARIETTAKVDIARMEKDKELELARIDKDKKVYEMLETFSNKIAGSQGERLKQNALYKPIEANPDVVLKTKEKKYVHNNEPKKEIQQVGEQVISGEFFVDGVRGLSTDITTFYLVQDEETYSIRFGKGEADIFKFGQLMRGLHKTIRADITVMLKGGKIAKRTIDNIEVKD